MRDVLWAHTKTLLRFFARHRVLLVFAIIMVGIWMIGFIPYLSYQSTGQRFNVLHTIASQLHGLAWFGGAGLGLVAMSSMRVLPSDWAYLLASLWNTRGWW